MIEVIESTSSDPIASKRGRWRRDTLEPLDKSNINFWATEAPNGKWTALVGQMVLTREREFGKSWGISGGLRGIELT